MLLPSLSNWLRLRCVCVRLLLLMPLVSTTASAATLLGIVSERSAAEAAAGAHALVEALPEHQVMLRTPEQLELLSDEQVRALWQDADALFLAAVFGDQVGRLERLLRQHPPAASTPILAMNSDRRITRLTRLGGEAVLASLSDERIGEISANPEAGEDAVEHLHKLRQSYPEQAEWVTGRAYYQGRSPEHIEGMLRWLLAQAGENVEVRAPQPRQVVRYYRQGKALASAAELNLDNGPAVALLDLDYGDRPGDKQLLDALCQSLEARKLQCFAVLARWGGASVEAVQTLAERARPAEVVAVVSLQDFVVGGGEGREPVTQALLELNVPILKGVKLSGTTKAEWRSSADGIPRETVHYRLAMPELQGVTQPLVLAAAQPPFTDAVTGVRLLLKQPVLEQVESMAGRIQRWHRLQQLDNGNKKVALIYYNHPPGRHNIGADKLDVPESLWHILKRLEEAGYHTGELPKSAAALHDEIQKRGVNLVDNRGELDKLRGQVPALTAINYQQYFETLPPSIRAELEHGPAGYLHARLVEALAQKQKAQARNMLSNGIADLRNMIENHEHKAQARALDLLAQYESGWTALIDGKGHEQSLEKLRDALINTGIPGLSGWGKAPGRAMISGRDMLFPGIQFGNVFIGPQPPRGWEVDEALLHANTSFPPTHHYVGFYHWLRDHFKADALVYLGRHSTHEFLPRRRAGLAADDYPQILGGDLPVIYPYIVDGVGEGIQAKRRAMAVMISHLTPPLATTELYDQLLELRQLVETFEAATDKNSPTRSRAAGTLRQRIRELNLTAEIASELAKDHRPFDEHDEHDGQDEHEDHEKHDHLENDQHINHGSIITNLDDVNEELLVHEVGHYVTTMQERFMPMGLHIFGKDWQPSAIDTMLSSMAGDGEIEDAWRRDLSASPAAEMNNLLAALAGEFIPPGRGNDPIRTPAVLPTGTNFHALSSDLIPTRVAWSLGAQMAADARAQDGAQPKGSEAVILWASDTVRDEGVMIAFGLDMLGVRPVWNSRGIVQHLERLPLEGERTRRDVVFTTSGLFRDLYEDQLVWLDQAVRVALAGSANTINRLHPQLRGALKEALAPLPEDALLPGDEPLEHNAVAARWVMDTRELLASGAAAEQAGTQAALRVFGTAPGAYGAGVNRLVERSGAWQARSELAAAYLRRMGHAYGKEQSGEPAQAAFAKRVENIGRTYLGRASHLYGLLDNDDGFDYQGGLSLAVESLAGAAPQNYVLQHADVNNPRVESLERALLGELRSRNLNPQWLQALMPHGYAGARTMGADFLDNLWGWQVTNPNVVKSWAWDAVYDVYFEDSHDIGIDAFLEQGHNIHVKTQMQAMMLVAAHRGFWEAAPEVIAEQAQSFAQAVVEHGLPGGGHTRADHPTMEWIAEQLQDKQLRQAFIDVRQAAMLTKPQQQNSPAHVTELLLQNQQENAQQKRGAQPAQQQPQQSSLAKTESALAAGEGGAARLLPWLILLAVVVLIAGGMVAGRRPRLR